MATKKKTGPSPKSLKTMRACLPILADHGEGRDNFVELKPKLEAEGLKFTQPTGTYKVAGAGISATATSGPGEAVRAWGQKARRALAQAEG